MANEFVLTGSLKYEHDNDSFTRTFSYNVNQTSVDPAGGGPGVIVATTAAHVLVDPPNLTNYGLALIKNLDDADIIALGTDDVGSFVPFLELRPGESFVVRLTQGLTLYAKGETTDNRLEIYVWED